MRDRLAPVHWAVRRFGFIAFLAVIGYLFVISFNNTHEISDLKHDKNVAQNHASTNGKVARQVGSNLDTACKQVVSLGQKCAVPNSDQTIKQVTGKQGLQGIRGEPGEPGVNGRGIINTRINADGNLILTYTDASTVDAGHVRGRPGSTGATGKSITDASIQGNALILVFSDGTTRNVGVVVGDAGKAGSNGKNGQNGSAGKNGADGRSVSSVLAVAGKLIVSYSDGTSSDAGDLPVGPRGPAGRGIKSADYDSATGNLTITFDDGTTAGPFHVKGDTGDKGTDGTNGINGTNGQDGADGANGVDGTDGYPPGSFTFTDGTGITHTCTPDGSAGPGSQPHYSCPPDAPTPPP